MLILITNDDGIHARGINELIREIRKIADVLIVAPDREQSASSHSFTMDRPLRLNKFGENAYACDGTPTDCVMLGIHGILKHNIPDLLLSGINRGANMGEDITYSGTIAAAIEGSILGIPSVAISNSDGAAEGSYREAAKFVSKFVRQIDKLNMSRGTFLNINFPKLNGDRFKEYAFTLPGQRVYNDIIIKKTDPRGKDYYWIAGDCVWRDIEGSDHEAVSSGKVSISPLKVNFADFAEFERIKQINLKF
ncbi:MAG: 5'/3'-nucleotidase SurE [Candidatus Zixiibacteriota bacterium]